MPDRPALHGHAHYAVVAVLAALLLAAPAQGAVSKRKPTRPRVTTFVFSPATFAVAPARAAGQGKRVTTLRFTLSKRSTVKVSIAHKLAGRRSGGRCVKPTRKNAKRKACTRYHTVGKLVRGKMRAGRQAIAFSGRIKRHALPLGGYRARLVAIDSSHRRSKSRTATFTITSAAPSSGSSTTPAPTTPPPAQKRVVRPCTVTLPTIAAVQSAVAAAVPGAVVCLANGSFGKLNLNAKPPAEVVVQPATPGGATIAGATLSGSNLTLSGFNVVGDEVDIMPGSDHMTVEYNRISGGYYGVVGGPTDSTYVSDFTIRGNKFVGNFGEDAIRLNRYHDGPDADPYGALIEGNEITGVVEDGNHNDCLQTVWGGDHLYFLRNYIHGNNCQGFFVKDQDQNIDTLVVEDNLLIDHNLPCQPASLCPTWVLTPVQIYGPATNQIFRNNTIWVPDKDGQTWWRGSGLNGVQIDHNVIYHGTSDTTIAGYSESNNIVCKWDMPALSPTSQRNCNPPFANPAAKDYRLNNGIGVDWAPADQQYGP
jgi:hypothetical protein